MSRLVKFFAFVVGVALWALLSFANFLLLPSTGATLVASVPAKPAITAERDPPASQVARWRDEQAALRSAGNALLAAKFTARPDRFSPAPPTEPVTPRVTQQVAAIAIGSANAQRAPERTSFVGVATAEEIAADRGRKVAERKAKVAKAKAKARRELLARERAAGTQYASNQQDQFYYGRQQPVTATASPAFPAQPGYGASGSVRVAVATAPAAGKRAVRIAKTKARTERLARGTAGQRHAAPSYPGQRQAMPSVTAFGPQQSYGPFGRTW